MNISSSSTTLFSLPKETARPLVKTITDGKLTLEPEKTEEEKRLESSTLSFQRELTPEEQNRVLFLKNMLAQLMSLAGGTPSEEQKARIKEIEKELEKITGVKMNSSISNTVKMISGKKKEDEEEEQQRQMTGIDPKEAVHGKLSAQGESTNSGMQLLQRNAFFTKLDAQLTSL